MKKYEIWNGKTPINKVSAEEVLKDREDIRINLGDVFLVVDEYEIVSEIQFGHLIKSSYKMPIDYTLEQVAQAYVDNLNIGGEGSMPLDNMNLIKEQADKIDILNEQSSKLLLEKAKNEIQINNLNKNLANVTLELAKVKGGM